MDDNKIIKLYWDRNEDALYQTDIKYGRYCMSISYNIVGDMEDARECVNDTWLDAWRAMPPEKPTILSAFLGKITRRISIDRYRKNTADKRGGTILALQSELSECLPDIDNVETLVTARELSVIINEFINALPATERRVFVRRYWYADSVSDICTRFSFTKSRVKSMLHRTREKLKTTLEKEEYL